jgi:hypothetical protein
MMCGLGARIRRNLQNAVFYPARLAASVMIEKFAFMNGWVASEFLDLNHTSKSMLLVSLLIPKFAPGSSSARWRTSESGYYGRSMAMAVASPPPMHAEAMPRLRP